MSSKTKGIAEIELKTDRFTGPANKAKGALSNLGTQGKQSIEKIATGADRAKQSMSAMAGSASTSMSQVGRSATLAGSQVTQSAVRGSAAYNQLGISGQRAGSQISTGMVQAASATRQMTAATNQAGVSMGVMTLGIAALGTSIGTTFTGMSNLNKAHLKQNKAIQKVAKVTVGLARANDLLSSTQLAVRRFTLSIATMEEKGLQATDTYTIAKANLALQLQKLTTAQDDYKVKLLDIKLAEDDALQVADDLQDTYINMTISIANTGLMSAFLAKTLVPNLSKSWIIHKVHVIANTRAMLLFRGTVLKSIFNLKMFRISLIGATLSLRGLAIGVKGFMLALGPLGIALIAITTVWALWETNTFGVRDALQDLWNWLKIIMPVLSALELLVRSVFPPAEESISDMGLATEEAGAQIEQFGTTAQEMASDLKSSVIPDLQQLGTGFTDVADGAKIAGKALDELKKKQDLLSRAVFGGRLDSSAESLFGLTGIFSQTGRQLAGFRDAGLRVNIPGTRQAVAEAMARFGLTRSQAEQLTQRTIFARSRVLTTDRRTFAQGLADDRVGRINTSGGQFGGGGTDVGRANTSGEALFFADDPLNPGKTIGRRSQTMLEYVIRVRREQAKTLPAWDLLKRAGISHPAPYRFYFGNTAYTLALRQRNVANAKAWAASFAAAQRRAQAILEERRLAEIARVAGVAKRAGITVTEVMTMEQTDNGKFDLTNIIGFQDRIKLEATTV